MILKNLSQPQSQPIEMTEFICFGRSQDNHIVLDDAQAADRHARIEKKEDKYLLRDLRTASGTYLNGERIEQAYVSAGDVIRMGNEEFILQSPLEAEFEQKMASKNPKWNKELQRIPGIAQSDLPVLILGPSGTGKEVLSQYIHKLSWRRDAPVYTVNCSALTSSLAESELFGHVKGSFTGATQDRKGAFEAARNGTLILDEIGDLPLELQPKLLRALENKEIKPVGSDKVIPTNVRIIACTHQDLKKKIEKQEFRLDLFYRLNVIQINIPSLSERIEDFERLLFTFAKAAHTKFTFGAIQALKNYSWPGNIRELKNLVLKAKALVGRSEIREEDIESLIEFKTIDINPIGGALQIPIFDGNRKVNVIKEIEKQIIESRLLMNGGNQRKTADDLGIPRSTLNDRVKKYNIDVEALLRRKGEELWKGVSH